MKKKFYLLTTMLVLATVCLLGQNGKKFFKAGTEFVDSKKYEDAIVQFTSAIGAELFKYRILCGKRERV